MPSGFYVFFEKITQNQCRRQAGKTSVAKEFLKHSYLYSEENIRELLIFTKQKGALRRAASLSSPSADIWAQSLVKTSI